MHPKALELVKKSLGIEELPQKPEGSRHAVETAIDLSKKGDQTWDDGVLEINPYPIINSGNDESST